MKLNASITFFLCSDCRHVVRELPCYETDSGSSLCETCAKERVRALNKGSGWKRLWRAIKCGFIPKPKLVAKVVSIDIVV